MTEYLSTDPNAGEDYISADPNAGLTSALPGGGIGPTPAGCDKVGDLWSQTARAIRGALGGDAMFGDPERESLKDTGIGLQPTPANLLEGVMMMDPATSTGAVAETVGGAARLA